MLHLSSPPCILVWSDLPRVGALSDLFVVISELCVTAMLSLCGVYTMLLVANSSSIYGGWMELWYDRRLVTATWTEFVLVKNM
jgi:hypothetical protein